MHPLRIEGKTFDKLMTRQFGSKYYDTGRDVSAVVPRPGSKRLIRFGFLTRSIHSQLGVFRSTIAVSTDTHRVPLSHHVGWQFDLIPMSSGRVKTVHDTNPRLRAGGGSMSLGVPMDLGS